MLVALAGDAKEQIRLLAIEVHAVGILLQDHAGMLHRILGLVRAVRDRHAHAHVDAGQLIALDHGIHVARVDAALLHEQRAGSPDRVLA